MTASRIASELSHLSRQIGIGNAALYAIARGLEKLSGGRVRLIKYYLVAQPVREKDLTAPNRGRSIHVAEAGAVEIQGLDFGRPQAAIRYRIDNRCRCLVAGKDGALVGFQWFTLFDYPEDEVRCLFRLRPGDGCAWDFDIFVRPEYRMQPVFARLWDTCNRILRDSGVQWSLSRIDAFAADSRRAHARLGATAIGWAVFLTLGARQLAVFSSRPWLHLSLKDASAPVWEVSRLARAQSCTRFSDRA